MKLRYEPEALFEKYLAILSGISAGELMRSPKHQKTQEIWCAARFALAYNEYLHPCDVLIEESDAQTDVDFDLDLEGVAHPFQVTEVQMPGRRRGDGYREGAPTVIHDDLEGGTLHGIEWIRGSIEKKAAKNYAGMGSLNLLVYINFSGRNQLFVDLRESCSGVSRKFASVWLLSDNVLCCIHPNAAIPAWEGWMKIEPTVGRR